MHKIEGVYDRAEAEEIIGISKRKEELKKIAFFVKPGMDSFLGDIINGISSDYEVKKILVKSYKEIDQWMAWADISWFEWCDELVIYGSKLELANEKRIVCRLHSYEAFTDYHKKVNWDNVDKLVFVAEHIKKNVLKKININDEKAVVIPNGINLNKFTYKERKKGFNIAYVGYINYKKGPMLLLHAFKDIYDSDNEYKLYIAGQFQDERYVLYFNQMIEEMGLEKNVFYEGWQNDINKWLEDKNYILCTSVLEGHPVGIMEAMARGLKPLIHNFVGCRDIYPEEYIWNTSNELVTLIEKDYGNPMEYRKFIEKNYSLEKQIEKIKVCINSAFNELDKKGILELAKATIKSSKKIEDFMKDVTVSISNYNRGKMLSKDLNMGLKMGNTLKVIVDDGSLKELDYIKELEKNKQRYGINHMCISEKNEGLASSRVKGAQYVGTSKICVLDDDDILLCIHKEKLQNEINKLDKEEYALLIPRYIVNLSENNAFSIGYDRSIYENMTCKEILKDISETSEVKAIQAGAIMLTTDFKNNITSGIFDISEDFVTISKLLEKSLEKKIIVSDNYVHIRRINRNSLSKNVTSRKLTLTLLAQTFSLELSLKNNLITEEELLHYLTERGRLLERIYGFGYESALELRRFLIGKSMEKKLITYLNNKEIHIKNLSEIDGSFQALYEYVDKTKDSGSPKVSIVIPTYNRSKYLVKAIKSALKQSYKNIEIIISDDASVDDTEVSIKPFLKDTRVRYIKNTSNIGLSRNFKNSLYNLVQGKYAIYLSDDDYFINNNYIKDAVDILEEYEEINLVIASSKIYDESKQKYQAVKYSMSKIINGLNYFLMYENSEYYPHITSTVSVFRVDIAKKNECFKEKSLEVDLLLYLKLMIEGDIGVIYEESYVYTMHSNNISNSLDGNLSIKTVEALEKIKSLALEKDINPKTLEKWIDFRICKYLNWALDSYIRNNRKDYVNLIRNYIRKNYSYLENIIFKNKNI